MRLSVRVRASRVPGEASSLLPRYRCHPIRTFSVVCDEAGRFTSWKNSSRNKRFEFISFISLWRDWRPALLRQDRPWRPSADTMVSQTHLCGRTKGAPRRRPAAAMRTDASSSLRPIPGRGRAFSQSPDPQALDASSLACSVLSVAKSYRKSAAVLQHLSSRIRWVSTSGNSNCWATESYKQL